MCRAAETTANLLVSSQESQVDTKGFFSTRVLGVSFGHGSPGRSFSKHVSERESRLTSMLDAALKPTCPSPLWLITFKSVISNLLNVHSLHQ